jgi:hypothetical protein
MPAVLLFMKGHFSQFHPSRFTLGGHDYICAEQYMHEQKRGSGDAMAQPSQATAHTQDDGGRVAGFDQAWDAHKVNIVTTGTRAKFGQNAGLRRRLLDTRDAILAEANPKDYIWGIGLAEDDPAAQDPANWQGENLLGQILMTVRSELSANSSDRHLPA